MLPRELLSYGLQIIHAVLKNPEDKTQIALLYANCTSEDILLRQHLEELAEKHDNFSVWHTSECLCPVLQSRGDKASFHPCACVCMPCAFAGL